MKLKSLFVFNAITAIIFGVGSVLAPQALVSLFGATLNPAGMLMMRYGGAWLIGIGLLACFRQQSGIASAVHCSFQQLQNLLAHLQNLKKINIRIIGRKRLPCGRNYLIPDRVGSLTAESFWLPQID